jgi:glycosyltransferase involved in cell wall biosynthesis
MSSSKIGSFKPAGARESVDVLMPTYNSAQYLDSALRSVEKAIPSCRLIAVDHFSTDGTIEILKKHGAHVYSDDKSLGHARQLLFEESTSPVVLMYDSDVVIGEEGWYKRAVRLLGTRSENGKPIGAVALLPNINPPVELENFKRFWWRLMPSLERNFFVTHSTLFLRESVRGIRIPERLGAAEDIYIWLHIRKRGYVSRTMTVAGIHYFTLSEKKGRWMGANLRILQSVVGKDARPFVLRNVLFYPFLAFVAATFTRDFHMLHYNIRRWFGYLVGYLFPKRYWQINRDSTSPSRSYGQAAVHRDSSNLAIPES